MESMETLLIYFSVYITVYSEHSKIKKKLKEKLSYGRLLLIAKNWTIKILCLSFYAIKSEKVNAHRSGKTSCIIFPSASKIDFLDLTNFRIVLMILCVLVYKYTCLYMYILRYQKCSKLSSQGRGRLLEGAQNSLFSELQVRLFTLLKVNLTTKVLSCS